VIIVVVGAVGIANYMFSNVQERRQEIGTLMAVGMTSRGILKVFLVKAILLGLVGGWWVTSSARRWRSAWGLALRRFRCSHSRRGSSGRS